MRFLSCRNKKKLRQKDSNPEHQAFGLVHRPEKHVKICHFFLVNLGTFGRFLLGWNSGNHPDFFKTLLAALVVFVRHTRVDWKGSGMSSKGSPFLNCFYVVLKFMFIYCKSQKNLPSNLDLTNI
jgi:hypothetical protein